MKLKNIILLEDKTTLNDYQQNTIRNILMSSKFYSKLADKVIRVEFAKDGDYNYCQMRTIGHSPVNGETYWGDFGGSVNTGNSNGKEIGIYMEFWIDRPESYYITYPLKNLYAWFPDIYNKDKNKAYVTIKDGKKTAFHPYYPDKVSYARWLDRKTVLNKELKEVLEKARVKLATMAKL